MFSVYKSMIERNKNIDVLCVGIMCKSVYDRCGWQTVSMVEIMECKTGV